MCGIFGYEGAGPVDVPTLERVAGLAARRGPHGCGIAWSQGRHYLRRARWVEPWTQVAREALLLLAPDAPTSVIGHCRLATSGDRRDVASTHPIAIGPGYIVHNGNVANHRARAASEGVDLATDCDSELLGRWVERAPNRKRLAARVASAIGNLEPAAPFVLLALWPGELAAARRGLPLYSFEDGRGGRYFCSVDPGGGAKLIEEVSVKAKKSTKVPVKKAAAAPAEAGPVRRAPADHPIAAVVWVDPATLHSNSYNPNRVFKTELELLKLSIMADGWTQPIVARADGEIIDGFHRWTLGTADADIRALAGGLVPVVHLSAQDAVRQMMSTVRHNRARGQHGILKMGDIVRAAKEAGLSEKEICRGMGMEVEELDRLADTRSSPEHAGKDSFGRGWVPDPNATGKG